jgi:DMSO/TMAO reductase YedYZ molybdopterin-dependent catalytic subunit
MAGSRLPLLFRLNRRISWLLVLVSAVVLLMGYSSTIMDLGGSLFSWGHRVLGGVFGLLIAVHMYTSVFLLRFRWRATLKRVWAGEAGSLTWLRLIQRVSAWALFLSAFLVLVSGLDWFKVGTGWLVPFASHVRYDVFLSVSIVVHSSVGLHFALMRRRVSRREKGEEAVSLARRQAIAVIGGAFLSLVAAVYLDRIPLVADAVEGVRGMLPPGQYEVGRLRALHVGGVPRFDEGSWTLEVGGLVENPISMDYGEVRGLPSVVSVSDFHCVTGWTKFGNRWKGVGFRTIMAMVRPLETAGYVLIRCEQGYTTSLPLGDLDREDVLLAYGLDGGELPNRFGGPLRLVVPHKYGYKSAKWVRGIRFLGENELGYWEQRGYSDNADPFTEDRYSDWRSTA